MRLARSFVHPPICSTNLVTSAGGTAALAEIRNNAGIVITSGLTVGTSGTDVVLNTTSISAGQNLTISSATLTHG